MKKKTKRVSVKSVKRPKLEPLAKNGIVLRDFNLGSHTFKKGTRDSWDQVKLPGGTDYTLKVLGVYLKQGFTSEEEERRMERERQQEADRQLEQLAAQLEREREEETRKRLAKIAERKRVEAENLSRGKDFGVEKAKTK